MGQAFRARIFWCDLLGIKIIEQRQLIYRCNSSLKFMIFDERNAQHSRLHFHALINGEKVASVYLDNLEIDFMSSRIKKGDERKIVEWVTSNKDALMEIHQKNDGSFEIPFNIFN